MTCFNYKAPKNKIKNDAKRLNKVYTPNVRLYKQLRNCLREQEYR